MRIKNRQLKGLLCPVKVYLGKVILLCKYPASIVCVVVTFYFPHISLFIQTNFVERKMRITNRASDSPG